VAEVVGLMSEQEPVRIPTNVLEELESVRRYTRIELLDIPTLRQVAMESGKPALVVWIDKHEQEYGRGLRRSGLGGVVRWTNRNNHAGDLREGNFCGLVQPLDS
jgi:hypothetical protein